MYRGNGIGVPLAALTHCTKNELQVLQAGIRYWWCSLRTLGAVLVVVCTCARRRFCVVKTAQEQNYE